MTLRENVLAVLHFQGYEKMPLLHFGFWDETLEKWHGEGHITAEEAAGWRDGNEFEVSINQKIGFDANWLAQVFSPKTFLHPAFEPEILEKYSDGSVKMIDENGIIVIKKAGVTSIPAEVDYLLQDRDVWERDFKPRLLYSDDRIDFEALESYKRLAEISDVHVGLEAGSLFGKIRNMLGVQGSAYLYADDEDLFREIVDTVGELCFSTVKKVLEHGFVPDFIHFWEDICFKNGPLVIPSVFDEMVGPHYRRITELCLQYGTDIVSLDCDGLIDSLLPIWVGNGVNTMFPIEVGTWNASIAPWREKYGRKILGVGGMNKNVFSRDRAQVDAELARLKELSELGGYIPCPDHRLAPDTEWELLLYYADRFRSVFGV